MLTVTNAEADSTIISNRFIDEYMRDANDAQIKIYLFLVRMMAVGRATSIPAIADAFNHTEKEVVRSLQYWERRNILSLDYAKDGSLSGVHLQKGKEPVMEPAKKTRPKEETASFFEKKKNAELLFVIEQYIGKPLSPNEMASVQRISQELHFSHDLIDYLLQYCVDRGKKDFRYIEKVAENWAKNGITTPAGAEKMSCEKAGKKRRTAKAGTFRNMDNPAYDFSALEKRLVDNE